VGAADAVPVGGIEDEHPRPDHVFTGATKSLASRGAVPDTMILEPRLTARENPTRLS
jgi:hypothetical protein